MTILFVEQSSLHWVCWIFRDVQKYSDDLPKSAPGLLLTLNITLVSVGCNLVPLSWIQLNSFQLNSASLSRVQHTYVQYSTLMYSTAHLQYITAHLCTVQHTYEQYSTLFFYRTEHLQYSVMHWNVVPSIAHFSIVPEPCVQKGCTFFVWAWKSKQGSTLIVKKFFFTSVLHSLVK